MEDAAFLIPPLILLSFIPAYVAYHKGRSFGKWYLYGLVIWPLAVVHAIFIDARKPCPHCAEMIMYNARICPFCWSEQHGEVTAGKYVDNRRRDMAKRSTYN